MTLPDINATVLPSPVEIAAAVPIFNTRASVGYARLTVS
jgi:hypothetical protein